MFFSLVSVLFLMLISVTVRPKPNLSKLENYGIDNLVVVPSM